MWFKNARYMALKKKKMKNLKLDSPFNAVAELKEKVLQVALVR